MLLNTGCNLLDATTKNYIDACAMRKNHYIDLERKLLARLRRLV